MRFSRPVGVALALFVLLAACSPQSATSTPMPPATTIPTPVPPTSTAPTPVPPTATAASGTTAGQLAQLGKTVYDRSCSRCHDGGVGPAVTIWVQTFGNAQQLYDYASRRMPQGDPGSLQPEQYFQIVAWALVDQKIVSADAVLDINKLADVALK